ncbi:uncharacterized protein LOC131025522 [Salvia miltiorrhiza]|uniref:uncharacterized protein LOC131025522 n=1 Tax=Salvia miltiorrhiza TaxID=226208 RepID=UPI0025AB8EDA|nr:uncharacterized protein LOC131025522 [Salvia miltiorrhiza]
MGVQHPNKNQKGAKNVAWCVKEDVALMSSWIYASEDNVRGKNQRGESLWTRVHKLYHNTQAENPNELNERNIESMKGRWKRLNENGNKWVAACREANARRRSGMSNNDVEKEVHSIYEAELRAMRLTRDAEAELIKTRIELKREKLQRNAMKIKEKMLLELLAKEYLSQEDEEMKRQLTKIVFGE